MKIITWLWIQTPNRHGYDADKVNVWAANLRRISSEPLELAVVTEHPEGIDPSIEIIKPPGEFLDVKIDAWKESNLAPQCYRRLAMFAPDAAEWIGADEWVCMDLDVSVGERTLDGLFVPGTDFRIMNGTSSSRPYNGGLIQMRAGARPQVYETFRKDPIRVALEARRQYVGSDQAVISMILGRGEKTFTPADGIEYFGPRWIRLNGGERRLVPPETMRLLFFPGAPKPWELLDTYGFINLGWHDGRPRGSATSVPDRRPRGRRERVYLWAYDDPKRWGRSFKRECDRISGVTCRLFVRECRVPDGERAFVRLDQQGAQREISRDIVFALHRRRCITLPTRREAEWYDDKVAQIPALSRYMPATWHITDPEKAARVAAAIPWARGMRLVSKAAEGSSSANVRILASREDALEEIDRAFGPGIGLQYDRVQRGYVYWQRLIESNPCDYRVCVVGDGLYGLRRQNRPGTPFASGSGNFAPLKMDDERSRAAAELAIRISREIDTRWMAYDFVFGDDGPLVLEMSSAWTMRAYEACPMFDFALRPLKQTGARSFRIAVDLLRSMELDEKAAAA
ncbi:MAG TPA: hypothetical protein VK116_07215 [Planctomycetota bacterium]|nr:hypothetical protein [Planctomycetota bacterium]